MKATCSIEEWDETHPRWHEFIACLENVAPDQVPFVLGEIYRAYPSVLFVALQENAVVGFIRFAVQPIGPEAECPTLSLNGVPLTEAKIHAFAVRDDARGQGIGKVLQQQALRRAKEMGCYQVASYSSYGRDANHHIKLSLGFGAQPEVHGEGHQGVYFLMPLGNHHSDLTYPDNVIPSLRFQFCPLCAERLTRIELFDDNIPRVTCPACGWIQLSTNAVSVVVIARNEQGIAVIFPPGESGVGLPAGLVEYGEDPAEAGVREVLEETGLEARIVECLGWIFVNRASWPGAMVQFIYEAEITGGQLKGSDEGEAKIIPLSEFPAISPTRTGSQKAMQIYLNKIGNQ